MPVMQDLDRDQWQQLKAVLTTALKLPLSERVAMLEQALKNDPALKDCAVEMLQSYRHCDPPVRHDRRDHHNRRHGRHPRQSALVLAWPSAIRSVITACFASSVRAAWAWCIWRRTNGWGVRSR